MAILTGMADMPPLMMKRAMPVSLFAALSPQAGEGDKDSLREFNVNRA